MVYTRVHFSPFGSTYTSGKSTPRIQILLSWVYAPHALFPRHLVNSGLGSSNISLGSSFVRTKPYLCPNVMALTQYDKIDNDDY